MDNKDKIIIILGVIIIIFGIISALSVFEINLNLSGEEITKAYDFEAFTMNVSAESNFTKNDSEEGVVIYEDNNRDVEISYLYTDTLATGIGALGIKTTLENYPVIPSGEYPKLDNPNNHILNNLTVFKVNDSDDNHTKYVALYNPEGIFILVACDDLDELIKMMNTISIKTIINNTVENNTSSTSNDNSNLESSSQEEYGDWQEDYFTGEYDSNGNPIYRSVMSTSQEGQYSPGIYESYWSADGPISDERIG